MSTSRRTFVTETVRGVVGALAVPPIMRVLPLTSPVVRRTLPDSWLPEPTPADTFRGLALQALDAARQAGATFADIRVGERRSFSVIPYPTAQLTARAGYGIRVLVDGAWGMAYGEQLSTDAVTRLAQEAVAAASAYAKINARTGGGHVALAPAPVVTGEWTSPATVSPFAMPLDDHVRVLSSWRYIAAPYFACSVDARLTWIGETRLVATSEGTLVTQYRTRLDPLVTVSHSGIERRVLALAPATGGFERVTGAELPDQIRLSIEDTLRLGQIPTRPFGQVGRFSVVLDGEAMARVLGTTLGAALDADRVVGFEEDTAGRSLLTAAETLPFSPIVTIAASRAAPVYTAVQWDDEGVATTPETLIDHGRVHHFLATRETVPILGSTQRLTGAAVAPDPTQMVMSGGAHLTLSPAPVKTSVDALLRNVTHGLLCYGGTCLPEPGLSSGIMYSPTLFEVRDGQLVARVDDVMLQFQARPWWTGCLQALGDSSTARTTLVPIQKGMPWQSISRGVTAPAALLADVDVVYRP